MPTEGKVQEPSILETEQEKQKRIEREQLMRKFFDELADVRVNSTY